MLTIQPAVELALQGAAARIHAGSSADSIRLLRAIASVETRGGAWNVPRHENGWCPNQRAGFNQDVRDRHLRFGCVSCCSWGPWQILYHTAADLGFQGEPAALAVPSMSVLYVVARLNQIIAGPADSESVEQLADAWNSGTYRDAIVPAAYVAKVVKAYQEAE